MQETDLVLDLIKELSSRNCNGHAKIRLGTALADPDRFRNIFSHYARGTYYENVDLEIEERNPVVQCRCGFQDRFPTPETVSTCPSCRGQPRLVQGTEFEILKPNGH